MVSKLTIKLIAAASSIALLAGGGAGAKAKSIDFSDEQDRAEQFESGALMQRFLSTDGARDATSARLAIAMIMDGLPATDYGRLADLTRDLRGVGLDAEIESAAVDALIEGLRHRSGTVITADEAADYTAQVFDAHVLPVQVADASGSGETIVQVAATPGESVGITDMVQRQARGIFEQNIRELVIEDEVLYQEIVETGPDSALRITLLDETSLTLGPSSRVVLDEFVYDPDAQDGRLAMRLISGVFRFTSGLMPKSRYAIDTPVGDIGIRGTVLDMYLTCETGNEDECELVIDVEEGAGTLNHPTGETDMNQGQRVTANTNENEEPEVEEIPQNEPPLPVVLDMQQRVLAATIETLEGYLPTGSISTADDAALEEALRQLLEANPNVADLLVQALKEIAPARMDTLLAAIALYAPGQVTKVAQEATTFDGEGTQFGESEGNPPTELTNTSSESEQSPPPYNAQPQ